jgi:lipoyl(octanoyl) transferase
MKLIIRQLPLTDYHSSWERMRTFTSERNEETPDELWLLEHPPVFTQGVAGKPEHVLNPDNIPVVQTDRGGQVTYHGPGQLMIYTLFDLHRLNLGTRTLVSTLEQSIIDALADLNIKAYGKRDAPGIYVDETKIASIGLRVRKGKSYHGVALNVENDLSPFNNINPCGFKDLKMTRISDHHPSTLEKTREHIIPYFLKHFPWSTHEQRTTI